MPQRDDSTTPGDPQQIIDNQRREIERLRALRPAVVTRKMCGGGNRTHRGAVH